MFSRFGRAGCQYSCVSSFVEERESLVRFLADDTAATKNALRAMSMIFEETDAAVVRLGHRPGALGRAAARLGENQINIDYSYFGLEPGSARVLLIFGVDSLTKACKVLDELASQEQAETQASAKPA